jgi:hypothetical protein
MGLWTYRYDGAMLRYLQGWIDQLRWQRLAPFQRHATGPPRRHPELLPHQGTLRRGGSDQGQHQSSSSRSRGHKNLGYLLLKAQRMEVTKTEFSVRQKAA